MEGMVLGHGVWVFGVPGFRVSLASGSGSVVRAHEKLNPVSSQELQFKGFTPTLNHKA